MVLPGCAPRQGERSDYPRHVGSQRWGLAGSAGVGAEGLEELCGGSALWESYSVTCRLWCVAVSPRLTPPAIPVC